MRRRTPTRSILGVALLLVPALGTAPISAQARADSGAVLTLDEAIAEARRANAQLPLASLDVQSALARSEQARGALYPALSLDGDVHGGIPQKYASGDAFVRLLARAPLYEGGELRAARDRSDAEAQALKAGYRVAVREVDYAVRADYGRVRRAEDGLALRRRGIERLRSYLTVVQSREASGQGVGSDLLRTRQRLAAAQADLASLRREVNDARMALDDVLGRDPEAPLRLASLASPTPPADTTGQPWLATPDVAQSASRIHAAEAGLRAARGGRKLHVDLEADVGAQPVLNSDVALLNNGRGGGGELTLFFSLPFWDGGVFRGRMAEARATLDQAHREQTVVRRASRLAWTRAARALGDLYREYEARDRAADVARDAYLQTESLYRGGQGSSLDVLDAYDAWIQANQDRLDVIYAYRVAEADLDRWGNS